MDAPLLVARRLFILILIFHLFSFRSVPSIHVHLTRMNVKRVERRFSYGCKCGRQMLLFEFSSCASLFLWFLHNVHSKCFEPSTEFLRFLSHSIFPSSSNLVSLTHYPNPDTMIGNTFPPSGICGVHIRGYRILKKRQRRL